MGRKKEEEGEKDRLAVISPVLRGTEAYVTIEL
mgnify:CR=1 FL=1